MKADDSPIAQAGSEFPTLPFGASSPLAGTRVHQSHKRFCEPLSIFFLEMDMSGAGVEVAPSMERSAGALALTGKGAAKKAAAGKKCTKGVNNTAKEVGKMVDEVSTP